VTRLRWYLGTIAVAGTATAAFCIYLFKVPGTKRADPTMLVGTSIAILSAVLLIWVFRYAWPKPAFWAMTSVILVMHAVPVAVFARLKPPPLLFPGLVAFAWVVAFLAAPAILHPSGADRHAAIDSVRRVFGGTPRSRR
jgi:hypothetical protein